MDLLARLQASRQTTVTVDRWTFTVRRPTQEEAITLLPVTISAGLLARFLVGWDGVTADDILPQAGMDAAPFSAELAESWLADHTELWEPLATAIMETYDRWRGAVHDDPKP